MRISPRPQHQTVAAASKLAVSQASQGSPAQPSLPVIQLVDSRVATAAASGTGAFREDAVHKRWSIRHNVDIDY